MIQLSDVLAWTLVAWTLAQKTPLTFARGARYLWRSFKGSRREIHSMADGVREGNSAVSTVLTCSVLSACIIPLEASKAWMTLSTWG